MTGCDLDVGVKTILKRTLNEWDGVKWIILVQSGAEEDVWVRGG
jgi:hypothetical protein